jgi:hypothetical protein
MHIKFSSAVRCAPDDGIVMSKTNAGIGNEAGRPIPREEQRGAPRFAFGTRPCWHLVAADRGDSQKAQVHDISATGIGLLCQDHIKPGTVVIITLHDTQQRRFRPMPVRVMHATVQPDGLWLIGGAFNRKLSDGELQAILHEAP